MVFTLTGIIVRYCLPSPNTSEHWQGGETLLLFFCCVLKSRKTLRGNQKAFKTLLTISIMYANVTISFYSFRRATNLLYSIRRNPTSHCSTTLLHSVRRWTFPFFPICHRIQTSSGTPTTWSLMPCLASVLRDLLGRILLTLYRRWCRVHCL